MLVGIVDYRVQGVLLRGTGSKGEVSQRALDSQLGSLELRTQLVGKELVFPSGPSQSPDLPLLKYRGIGAGTWF